MSEKIYILKKYKGEDEYSEFSCELFEKVTPKLNHLKLSILNDNKRLNHSLIKLPEESITNLGNLLSHFGLESFIDEFFSFITISQNYYLNYLESSREFKKDNLHQNFLDQKRDLKYLFDILEQYLFQDKRELYSISFKYNTETTKTIKNFFIISEIYEGLIEYYGLTKDNFSLKKEELLKDDNSFNFKKGYSEIISEITISIFNFIKTQKKEISDGKALQFCGIFLHICQIPSNKKDDDIEIGDIENSLANIDIKNLRHIKNPRTKYLS